MNICASLTDADSQSSLLSCSLANSQGADMVEIRFDFQKKICPEDYIDVPIPKIATLREASEGGRFFGTKEEKMAVLSSAADVGFDYIDIELDENTEVFTKCAKTCKIICSHHDFSKTPSPEEIVSTLKEAFEFSDIAKAAYATCGIRDLLALKEASELAYSEGIKFVLIGMNELGAITRVRASLMRSEFTFASLSLDTQSAPGQLTVQEMKRLGDVPLVCGVIGDPISHSMSPAIHNALMASSGIKGIYLPFRFSKDELPLLPDLMRSYGIKGVNVTIPHKENILTYLDTLTDSVKETNATNTVILENNCFVGYNTDIQGFDYAFSDLSLKGKNVLVAGSGGAAASCCSFLHAFDANIHIHSRNAKKAEAMAKRFKGKFLSENELSEQRFDVLINCTPLGMKGFPSDLPVPKECIGEGMVVMDVVYNPHITPLLAEASSKGASIIPGNEMLIGQAEESFFIFTGEKANKALMHEIFCT
ncbi:MAG: shikimate dehydrogenase [Methanomicrobiales archaeon]|jgi:shikimate dehydrogenase/3-dehydroquinate dehydratase type I|nr:shikimate dehydrogenase [Methanomicrobiales archaeon]